MSTHPFPTRLLSQFVQTTIRYTMCIYVDKTLLVYEYCYQPLKHHSRLGRPPRRPKSLKKQLEIDYGTYIHTLSHSRSLSLLLLSPFIQINRVEMLNPKTSHC